MSNRRFPPPWSIEDIAAAYVVKDGSGQKLGQFLISRRTGGCLSRDEARTQIVASPLWYFIGRLDHQVFQKKIGICR